MKEKFSILVLISISDKQNLIICNKKTMTSNKLLLY